MKFIPIGDGKFGKWADYVCPYGQKNCPVCKALVVRFKIDSCFPWIKLHETDTDLREGDMPSTQPSS